MKSILARYINKSFFLLTLLLLTLLLLAACTTDSDTTDVNITETNTEETGIDNTDAVTSATMSRYRENEIQFYEGARLDPAVGPSDNSIHGVQYIEMDYYSLKIWGLVDTPVELSYDDVLALDHYTRKITLHCVTGWDATILWEGVLMSDLMALAGVDDDAKTVIFHAGDGYTTSLPLETIVDKELILAYAANGLELPPEMGYPFIFVAEDKFGYKWARWVTQIELSSDTDYEGYWEQRGYDNDADIE